MNLKFNFSHDKKYPILGIYLYAYLGLLASQTIKKNVVKKLITLTSICLVLSFNTKAQVDPFKLKTAENIKQKLEHLDSLYNAHSEELNESELNITNFKKEIDTTKNLSLETYIEKIKSQSKQYDLVKKLNKIIDEAEAYKTYYNLEIKDDALGIGKNLDTYFTKKPKDKIDIKKEAEAKTKTYLYFGKNKVIAEDNPIFNNKEFNTVFQDLLDEKSEAYLGDFVIPQNGQKIQLHVPKRKKNNSTHEKDSIQIKYKRVFKIGNEADTALRFKKLKIHVLHGLIQDIKVILTDQENEYLFENRFPISLLKYSRLAPINYMFYRHTLSNKKNKVIDEKFKNHSIKLADVLMYINNPGENFVPNELKLEFPTKTNNKLDNHSGPLIYKVEQDTSLENVLNLRTYTDFLSLLGDSPNGIFQLEGKADFYLAPFNLRNTNLFLFKKISPYVNFARIDEELRNISVENDSTLVNKLEILEKSYLNMGAELDVFNLRFTKEFPFDITLYAKAQYNISDVLDEDSTAVNYKSFGLGGGLRIDVKRYNNFGFTMKSEFTNINTDEFNNLNFVTDPKDFVVFRNEAEIYYYPGKNKSQSVFLRLNTFKNHNHNNSEAFYQLQFGYRFSIGINKLKN